MRRQLQSPLTASLALAVLATTAHAGAADPVAQFATTLPFHLFTASFTPLAVAASLLIILRRERRC